MIIDIPVIASKHASSIGKAVLASINHINKIRADLFNNTTDLNSQMPNHMSDSIDTEKAVSRWLQQRAETPVTVLNYQCMQHVMSAAADGIESTFENNRDTKKKQGSCN